MLVRQAVAGAHDQRASGIKVMSRKKNLQTLGLHAGVDLCACHQIQGRAVLQGIIDASCVSTRRDVSFCDAPSPLCVKYTSELNFLDVSF